MGWERRLRHASNRGPVRPPQNSAFDEAAPRSGAVVRIGDANKRVLELILASTALVVASPLMLCLAVMIVIDSRGGILFRCSRVGRNGRTMSMLKFRKMQRGASGVALTTANDERFTRTSRFLARTKLDEVPQLSNVLRGDMSLVGPRPEDPEFVERFRDDYAEILRAKPGITGLLGWRSRRKAKSSTSTTLSRTTCHALYRRRSLLTAITPGIARFSWM